MKAQFIKEVTRLSDDIVDFPDIAFDPDNWTYDWGKYKNEFNLKDVSLLRKEVVPVDKIDFSTNTGRKTGVSDDDVEKLAQSFLVHGLDLNQPPIIVDENYCCQNGGTRGKTFPRVGIEDYCVWVVGYKDELAKVDLANKVNNPIRETFVRYPTLSDVKAGVEDYCYQYYEKNGEAPSRDELEKKIKEYGEHCLSKGDLKKVKALIVINGNVPVKPTRFKDWDSPSAEKWLREKSNEDELKEVADSIQFHNAKHDTGKQTNARWARMNQYAGELARDAVEKQVAIPGKIVVSTPPPKDETISSMNKSRENFAKELSDYHELELAKLQYHALFGCFPLEHPDAVIKYMPLLHEEVDKGWLIDS